MSAHSFIKATLDNFIPILLQLFAVSKLLRVSIVIMTLRRIVCQGQGQDLVSASKYKAT